MMSADKVLAPTLKPQKKNSRRVDVSRTQFTALVTELTMAMMATATLDVAQQPVQHADRLRKCTQAVYKLLAPLATAAFGRPMAPEVMFGLSVDGFSILEGVALLSFVYEESREQDRFQLQVHAPCAPFLTEWPQTLRTHGGDPELFLKRMALV